MILTIKNPLADHMTVVFYDLEYTSWKGFRESGWDMPGKYMEVVQIGAVRIDMLDDWNEINAFSAYVKPVRNPILSAYFTDLTGITQNHVDGEGHSFPDAMDLFMEFLHIDTAQLASHGPDHDIIALNCGYTGITCPESFERSINLRPWVMNTIGVHEAKYTSSELPEALGLEHDGKAHDALGDARAVAAVLRHLSEPDA
jgi:inhibitor of KinA sporulation pathway (predicted exonuclease)